jgi:hypothetical protein
MPDTADKPSAAVSRNRDYSQPRITPITRTSLNRPSSPIRVIRAIRGFKEAQSAGILHLVAPWRVSPDPKRPPESARARHLLHLRFKSLA